MSSYQRSGPHRQDYLKAEPTHYCASCFCHTMGVGAFWHVTRGQKNISGTIATLTERKRT